MTQILEALRRLSSRDFCALIHCGRTKLSNLINNDPDFPPPIKVGRLNFWTAEQVTEYLSREVPVSKPDSNKFRKLKADYRQEVKEGTRKPPAPRKRKTKGNPNEQPRRKQRGISKQRKLIVRV